MSYFRSINQAVTDSLPNDSTVNLDPGQFFTGTAASTLGVNAIQIGLKADKNCTVYVEQSNDSSNWDISDPYNYYSSISNFGVTVQAISSYFRTRVKNISDTSTSYFRLSSVLCPIVEAVPRSLDEFGNLKVGVKSLSDEYNWSVENTPLGEMRTVIPTRLVGASFDGNTLDPNFWDSTASTGASVSQSGVQVTISSGTNKGSFAKLYSHRRARYVSAECQRFRTVIQLSDTTTTTNVKRWGIGWGATMPTITDGAYFKMDGTTLKIETLKGGVPSTISSGSFNGVLGATYIPDTTAVPYEIYWTSFKAWFTINDTLLHTINSTAWANTMNYYVYLDSSNSGTSPTAFNCSIASISRLGALSTQPTSYFSGATSGVVLKYGTGNLHSLTVTGIPGATSTSQVGLYDNTAASGTVIFTTGSLNTGNTANNFTSNFPFTIDFKGIPFFNGLDMTCTNCSALVVYE